MEGLSHQLREPGLEAVLVLLDCFREARDLVVLKIDFTPLEKGLYNCLAPEPRSYRIALYCQLFESILAKLEIGGEQLTMLLFEEVRVKQQFPRLALSLSWWEGLSLQLIPVFLERGQCDLAGSCDADLDNPRPFLILELGLLINLRFDTLDRGHTPILKRQVVLLLVGLLCRSLALLTLATLAHGL